MPRHGFYGYSTPTLATPDLFLSLGLRNEPGTWTTCVRIGGTGAAPTEFWMSGADYLLLQSACYLLQAEWARAHPRAIESRAQKLVDTGEYIAVTADTSDAPRWLPPGGQRGPRPARRRRHLRIIPKPPA
jgi:hypothetical protein